MFEEIENFKAWMALPEVNRTCFETLMQDCMSDAETTAINKAINFIMSNPDGTELR